MCQAHKVKVAEDFALPA